VAPAGGRAHRPVCSAARFTGSLYERRQQLVQSRGVLLVQVDLVFRPVHAEPQRLVCRATFKIIF
jgi:hypothetical protein